MAKKGFGRFLAFVVVSSAIAAGISYVLQYHTFHKELENEFHNFEDDDEKDDETSTTIPDRRYVSLRADSDEFVIAAKETAQAAKGMASAAKGILKDVGNIIKDGASNLKSVAVDTSQALKDKAEQKLEKTLDQMEEDFEISSTEIDDLAGMDDETIEAQLEDIKTELKQEADTLQEISIVQGTQITEQVEEQDFPDLKLKLDHDVNNVSIKDSKLVHNEDIVIDLSSQDK